MYTIIDEASEEVLEYTSDLEEAIQDADNMLQGRCLILDEEDNIVYDTNPGISFKI